MAIYIQQSNKTKNFLAKILRYAFDALKKSKGQILVISSASGEVGLPMRTAYCASKFAVTGFFESLRIETRDSGVDITIVCPPSVKLFEISNHNWMKGRNSNERTCCYSESE